MKRITILLIFGLFIAANALAEKVEGVIIDNNDSTIHVTFKIPVGFFSGDINFERLQGKVKYYNALNKLITMLPHQVKEIRFRYQFEDIRMISVDDKIGLGSFFSASTKIFLQILMDGKLKVFRYYYTQHTAGSFNGATGMMTPGYAYSADRYILQKGDGELKRPRSLFFRKDMVEYFADCPELVKRIESKEYSKDDVEAMAGFYNINCSK